MRTLILAVAMVAAGPAIAQDGQLKNPSPVDMTQPFLTDQAEDLQPMKGPSVKALVEGLSEVGTVRSAPDSRSKIVQTPDGCVLRLGALIVKPVLVECASAPLERQKPRGAEGQEALK